MEITKSDRGFAYGIFNDQYGHKCSIQESSLASESCIWLGMEKPELTVFGSNESQFVTIPMPKEFSVFARMHLSQEQVAELIPILQKFVDTGYISD